MLAIAAGLNAQTVDRGPPPSRIAGTWQVSYEDLALGEIDGTAKIAPDGRSVSVVVRDGPQGAPFTLTSESISEQGDDYTIVLTGEGPAAAALLPDPTVQQQAIHAAADSVRAVLATYGAGVAAAPPNLNMFGNLQVAPIAGPKQPWAVGHATQPPDVTIAVPPDALQVGLEVGDYKASLGLAPRHPVETRRVVLSLHYAPSGGATGYSGPAGDLLAGTWKYYADPVTWRDGEGKGRVGNFRRDAQNPNLTTQSAAEVWFRPNPPAQLQFFAVGVFKDIKITALYPGVPTIVEAIFDEPQDTDSCMIEVKVGDQKLQLTAHRDPENGRRFVTDPFLPGTDSRTPPPPSGRPGPPPPDDSAPQSEQEP